MHDELTRERGKEGRKEERTEGRTKQNQVYEGTNVGGERSICKQ